MMRFWVVTVVVACSLPGAASTPNQDPLGKTKRFQIELVVRQGDPLGDREAESLDLKPDLRQEPGPARVLAEGKLTTREGTEISFRCNDNEEPKEERVDGAALKLGYGLHLVPTLTAEGKIRLKVTLEHTEVVTRTQDRLLVECGRNFFTRDLKTDEVCKLRWGRPRPGQQTWVELKVRLIKP